jgi:hypothetical protein
MQKFSDFIFFLKSVWLFMHLFMAGAIGLTQNCGAEGLFDSIPR